LAFFKQNVGRCVSRVAMKLLRRTPYGLRSTHHHLYSDRRRSSNPKFSVFDEMGLTTWYEINLHNQIQIYKQKLQTIKKNTWLFLKIAFLLLQPIAN